MVKTITLTASALYFLLTLPLFSGFWSEFLYTESDLPRRRHDRSDRVDPGAAVAVAARTHICAAAGVSPPSGSPSRSGSRSMKQSLCRRLSAIFIGVLRHLTTLLALMKRGNGDSGGAETAEVAQQQWR